MKAEQINGSETMKPHELLNAIGESLSPDAMAWWNGAASETKNDYVILAQREGLDIAVDAIEQDNGAAAG